VGGSVEMVVAVVMMAVVVAVVGTHGIETCSAAEWLVIEEAEEEMLVVGERPKEMRSHETCMIYEVK
jgi:hypothetical protein